MNHQQAFTLLELLVVVLIIGILAAVALPQYEKIVLKSRLTQTKALANTLAEAEEIYYMANGSYTADYEKLSISFPTPTQCEGHTETIYRCSFDWGYCQISKPSAYIECFLQKNNTNIISYQVNFDHNDWAPTQRMCIS